jgi:predicted nucleic acid-binding protein
LSYCVIDASVAVAWSIESETTDAIEALFERVGDEGATIPRLWLIETLNALLAAERRGRISGNQVEGDLLDFEMMRLTYDVFVPRDLWRQTLLLARRQGLTIYDATYLELAIREALPLATLDKALIVAARAEGVELVI